MLLVAWLAGSLYTMCYSCEPLRCLCSPVIESVPEPALIHQPSAPSHTRLQLRLILEWADGLQMPHTLRVKWTQWITLWTECFHCEDAAFPRHFRAAFSGYTLFFLQPVHMSTEIKCALSSNLICLEVSWWCQSEVINDIAGDFFWLLGFPLALIAVILFSWLDFLICSRGTIGECDVIWHQNISCVCVCAYFYSATC